MNFFERFKLLPVSSRRLLGIGIIAALVVALPLFIWAVVTQRFLIIKHAASGEPGVCVAQNNVITVTPESDTNGTCHDIQAAIDAVTGDSFTVQITPGIYDVQSTINISDKSRLILIGHETSGSSAVVINFNITSGGWGFLVTGSSGSIQWLTAQGSTPNGLLSIKDSSNFNVDYTKLSATSSHTMDVQNSNNLSIYNNEIQSSAGAIEVGSSNLVHIYNNKIHNSSNAIAVNDSQNTEIVANLITTNDESGIVLRNVSNLTVNHNTLSNNAKNGHIPIVDMSGIITSATFSNNIIARNFGAGISFTGTNIDAAFTRNDVWSNLDPNYVGIASQTGINGNISQDPLFNSADGSFCLQSGSPAIYGNIGNGEYMGYIGPCGTNPPPSPSPTPTPTPTPFADCFTCNQNNQCVFDAGCQMPGARCTGNAPCLISTPPPPTVRPFQINFKFGGVSDNSAESAKVTVRFREESNGAIDYSTPPIPANYIGNGIYQLYFATQLPDAVNYTISLKGEKHLAVRFCTPSGQTTHCSDGAGHIGIYNASGPEFLDFTGMPLEPGDVSPQDGMVNADDFAKITTLLSKPCSLLTAADKMVADLDYNGCVNIRDAFLIRKTLETRYDEN